MNGPRIRTDIVDVYVFRQRLPKEGPSVEFLQLRRREEPLAGSWQPVMGHVEAGETATDAAVRELREEIGLQAAGMECLGLWQLNGVHPFYMARGDAIVMSPRFAAQVRPEFEPRLCEEHDAWRWVAPEDVETCFMWPGQRLAIQEVMREIVGAASRSREHLRLDVGQGEVRPGQSGPRL